MPELTPPLKPSRSYGLLSIAVLAVVAIIALAAAWGAMVAVERTSSTAVERALFLAGEDWAGVEVNGLQVILSGDAPSEAARFAALSAAAHEVDGARVIDHMALPEAVAIEPPRFSVEMLRNEAGISLIGLIPAEVDRAALTRRMRAINPIQPVADFLETAEFATPEGWERALDFTLYVAEMLPRSKISMTADNVTVEAIATSPDEKQEWERAIRRERPAGLRLALDIRAPLDVISPYIVRFLSDEQGARFDACTAYTPADRNRIISAGIAAGVKGAVDCTIGLGVPSPDWPEAVARGIRAVRDMGGGSLTFSDADITLIAPADTPQDTFDRVAGELEADLPEVFSLHSVLSEPETGPVSPAGTPEFIATLAKDGAVQLRGRVAGEQDRTIVETLARARFGTQQVYAPLRLDPALPASWAVRTLAGLEALDQLADGRVVVRPEVVTVTGSTGDKRASAEISRLLSEKLGEAQDFRVNVKYVEALDPVAAMPTPQECVADVNAALTRSKITFAPGSAEIERASTATVDRIAEILKTCPDVAMEIGGYTDSQGREEMNQALSQRRAEAVVSALLARRVLTTNLKAFGYGEDFPIADNDTEDGREANRRIEFNLIGETRPRAEPTAGRDDDPKIRPPARPSALGGAGDGEGAATDTAAEDSGETEAEQTDGTTEEVAAEDAPTAATDPADEAADDTPDDPADDPADTGGTAADIASSADGDPAGNAPADAEAVTDPVTDEGTTPQAPAVDTVSDVGEDAAGDVVADAQDAGPAVETAATEAGSDIPGADDASAGADPETDAAAETASTDGAAARGEPAVVTADGVADTPETSAVADTAVDTGLVDTGPVDTGPVDTGPVDTGPVETGPVETGDLEATPAPEVPGPDLAAEKAPPSEISPETGDTPAVDDGLADPAAETDAGQPATTSDEPSTATDLEAAAEVSESADPAADTDAAAAIDDTGSDVAGEAPAVVAPTDIPAVRPRARPPLVVHPDLEGVRPRPRPAVVPDAPTTE